MDLFSPRWLGGTGLFPAWFGVEVEVSVKGVGSGPGFAPILEEIPTVNAYITGIRFVNETTVSVEPLTTWRSFKKIKEAPEVTVHSVRFIDANSN